MDIFATGVLSLPQQDSCGSGGRVGHLPFEKSVVIPDHSVMGLSLALLLYGIVCKCLGIDKSNVCVTGFMRPVLRIDQTMKIKLSSCIMICSKNNILSAYFRVQAKTCSSWMLLWTLTIILVSLSFIYFLTAALFLLPFTLDWGQTGLYSDIFRV